MTEPTTEPSPGIRVQRTGERALCDELLTVNFGPQHPGTHGVLRLVVDLDCEVVQGIKHGHDPGGRGSLSVRSGRSAQLLAESVGRWD